MSDLNFIPTDDLIDEICKRHDHIVIAGMKVCDEKGAYITVRRWQGNSFVCLGVVEVVKQMISGAEIFNSKPLGDNKDR